MCRARPSALIRGEYTLKAAWTRLCASRDRTRKVKLTRAFSLRDPDFTRLMMSIDNRDIIQFSAFIYDMCSFMAAYY